MSTITTIQSSDLITNSRTVINNNFSALNSDKIETSYLDTDTSLTANSDSKIPTQKAVKAYVDAGGNVNATETTKGIVEEATDAEVAAGTATGTTGAKLFITPAKFATYKATFNYLSTVAVGATTRDISTASGTQTIAHGLGVVPKIVRLTAVVSDSATNTSSETTAYAHAVYANSTQSSVSTYQKSTNSSGTGFDSEHTNAFRLRKSIGPNDYRADGTITVDSTNISIAWTKTGLPTGTANITWEAIA